MVILKIMNVVSVDPFTHMDIQFLDRTAAVSKIHILNGTTF